MNEINPTPTEEQPFAESVAQMDRSTEDTVTPIMFWGTIAQAAIMFLMSVAVIFLVFSGIAAPDSEQTGMGTAYLALTLTAVLAIANVSSIVLTIRKKQDIGYGLTYFSLAAFVLSFILIIQGRALTLSFFLLLPATLGIGWICPPRSRRLYIISTVIALVLAWVIEWINPSWRIAYSGAQFGPIAAIIFAIIFGAVIARQAWKRNNIRSRFLTFSIGLTLTAVTVIAYASVTSLLSAGRQAQETSSTVLREEAEEDLVHAAILTADENELILQSISQDAEYVARQAAEILENPNAFNTEEYWLADEHMFLGPEGQYINRDSDVSTVFIPNTVQITDNFKERLELLAFLDFAFVPVYEGDPNTVAIYYVGKEEISRLHPNINLGAIVPPDYLATQDVFYTIGAPENNPDRKVIWTPVYDDPGGQGLLVSAIAPVYVNNRFSGIVGIDVSLAGLTSAIEQENSDTGGYSLLLDSDGRALALPEQGYQDFYGRGREANEFGSDFVASARPEFAPVISDMLSGATDFQSVEVDGQEFYFAYSTMESTGWHVASVVTAEEVLAPATALQAELAELSNSLVFGRILPVGVVFIILVVAASIFFTNLLIRPIEQLTEGASKIGLGEWDAHLPESEMREIDGLSNTLGTMAAQLKDTLGSLEQRVADRTKALATSAEVSRRLATILDPGQLASEVVNEVRNAFDYYYAQIYLLDEAGESLVLASGTGEAGAAMMGRGHSVPKGRGLVGRAADANTSVLVPDVSQEEGWLPNDLLSETKAEAAIPISIGEQVLGVLDVQHSLVNGLTEDDVTLLESLAGQVAISLQNARSYEQSRSQAEMESLVNVIGQKIQRATTMEETLQTAIRELGTAIGASRVRAKIQRVSTTVETTPVEPTTPALAAEAERKNGSSGPESTFAE